jgi:nucleoside-diphosphate-sugar epimerase
VRIGIWGDGFIGSGIANELDNQGVDTVILKRNAAASWRKNSREMAFSSPEDAMTEAMADLTTLVHCAGSALDHYDEYRDATLRMGRAAVRAGVKRVIMFSTVAVYGSALPAMGLAEPVEIRKSLAPLPRTDYAASRFRTEIEMRGLLTSNAVEFIVVRIPMAIGPSMSATVLRKLFMLLRAHLFPRFSAQAAVLPCVGIQRLSSCLAWLACDQGAKLPLYQFADSIAWQDIIEVFAETFGVKVVNIRMPGSVILTILNVLGIERPATAVRSLMNTAWYEDDSHQVLALAGQYPETTVASMVRAVRWLQR